MTPSRALSNAAIFRAALIVLLGFVSSGILGFVRTGAYAAIFGAGPEIDAFYAAGRVPELLFTLVAGGALGSSFIPVFARYLKPETLDHAWKLASAVMTLSALAALSLALLLVIGAPVYVPVVLTPGYGPAQQALTISLTQLMLMTTVIFAVSGLSMGILNAHQSFLYPALAASMYNLGLIFGALVLTRILPPFSIHHDFVRANFETALGGFSLIPDANIYGLALGAILGASLHLVVQIPGLIKIRARLRVLMRWQVEGVREVLSLMLPRVLGLAVVQVNFIVNVAFASTMVAGSQTALTTAWFLLFFTLGIIAQSVGTAIFPTLSALVAENDMDGYKVRLSSAMRGVLFMSLPAMVGLIVLGEPVVSIFERGEWTRAETSATAWALAFYAVGIAGHSLLEVLSRAFYALANTWTPVRVGIAAMVSNIALSILFIAFIGEPGSLERGPFAGLALANSVTTLLESVILWVLLRRRIGGVQDRQVLTTLAKAGIAALGMGIIVWGIGEVLPDGGLMLRLMVGVGAGVLSFLVLALLLRMDELTIITRRLRRNRSS